MTAGGAVSLVVVSENRPEALARLLTSLRFQTCASFEVIVVADALSRAGIAGHEVIEHIKLVDQPEPNIARARNLGLAAAAGEVIAFCDDDAVPEPPWLERLTGPLLAGAAEAATGFVLGRDGISLQWGAERIDRLGRSEPLALDGADRILLPPQGGAIKTIGTNCAFQADILRKAGGFDEAYRFYLEDGDMALRLAAQRARTAVMPGAVVHHGFLASSRRSARRAPRDLTEIGASLAHFLVTHAPDTDPLPRLEEFATLERRRALGHMIAGTIEPRDVGRLLRGLRAGFAEGLARRQHLTAQWPAPPAFRPFPAAGPGLRQKVLAGGRAALARLRAEAEELARQGVLVSVFAFGPGWRRHRVVFDAGGFWLQTGGLRGRNTRGTPALKPATLAARLDAEVRRVAPLRGLAVD